VREMAIGFVCLIVCVHSSGLRISYEVNKSLICERRAFQKREKMTSSNILATEKATAQIIKGLEQIRFKTW
jgi:hypothetical protein